MGYEPGRTRFFLAALFLAASAGPAAALQAEPPQQ